MFLSIVRSILLHGEKRDQSVKDSSLKKAALNLGF